MSSLPFSTAASGASEMILLFWPVAWAKAVLPSAARRTSAKQEALSARRILPSFGVGSDLRGVGACRRGV